MKLFYLLEYDLSWVGWLNILILQWFCIRLAYRYPVGYKGKRVYLIMYWVKPTTGWSTNYKIWGGSAQYLRLGRKTS